MKNEPKRLFEVDIENAIRAELIDVLKQARKIALNSPNGAYIICDMIQKKLCE